jgi:hypothetical protein
VSRSPWAAPANAGTIRFRVDFGSLKGEPIDVQARPARAMARRAIVGDIAWCNGSRPHSTLGYAPPADFDEQDKIRKVAKQEA